MVPLLLLALQPLRHQHLQPARRHLPLPHQQLVPPHLPLPHQQLVLPHQQPPHL